MRWIDYKGKKPQDEKWLKKSDELTKKLIEAYQKGDLKARNEIIEKNSRHWGELKEWLFSFSHGKCWFSEAKDCYSHFDVEHFRPKKEVIDFDGTKRDGYWWLAFDYRNYRICGNVGNRQKGAHFPLKKGSACSTYSERHNAAPENGNHQLTLSFLLISPTLYF